MYGVKKISKMLSVLIVISVLVIIFNFSISTASAHSLTAWSNVYSTDNAGGEYQFAIMDSYHVNGNNVNYYWDNNTTKSYFSSALTDGVKMWGGMITATETSQSKAHVKITYNPNVIIDAAANVITVIPSYGHYEPNETTTTMNIFNIINYSYLQKTQVFGH